MRFGRQRILRWCRTNDSTIRAAHGRSKRDRRRKNMQNELPENYAALVAVDWADRTHQFSLSYPGILQREVGKVEHKPESLMDWIAELKTIPGIVMSC